MRRSRPFICRFPNREIPDRVESLTVDIGDWSSGFLIAWEEHTGFAIARMPISRFVKGEIVEECPVGDKDSREE